MMNKVALFGTFLILVFAVIAWRSLEGTEIIQLTDGQVIEAQVIRFSNDEFVLRVQPGDQPEAETGRALPAGKVKSIEFGKGKPLGVKHLFYAYALAWVFLLGYAVNLSFRHKQVAEELESLKETLARRSSE